VLAAILAPILSALAAAAAPLATPGAGNPVALRGLTPEQLAGQRVVYGFSGTAPPPALVTRIRRGEAGAVILLGANVDGLRGVRSLVARLQAIPRPPALDAPLLMMVDQEGGLVRRLPGPPSRSAAELGSAGPAAARAAGAAAGRLLHRAGINVNLAPVADVARDGSALARDGRTFGGSPAGVAGAAVAFADGLRAAGVAAAAKHFPGFGAAQDSTDERPVTIDLPAAELRDDDMRPFRALIAHGVPIVMLSTAVYPDLDPGRPAALSRAVATDELRGRLGFRGVVVTDALDTPALAPAGGTGAVAVRAMAAGGDLLIHTGFASGQTAARAIARGLRAGRLPADSARRSVARVLLLRARLRSSPPWGAATGTG